MNAQTATKMENKGKEKSNTAKSGISQDKAIDKLRQEIAALAKTFKTIQEKQDTQAIVVTMSNEMFNEINGSSGK